MPAAPRDYEQDFDHERWKDDGFEIVPTSLADVLAALGVTDWPAEQQAAAARQRRAEISPAAVAALTDAGLL